jgi:hypothetical protein
MSGMRQIPQPHGALAAIKAREFAEKEWGAAGEMATPRVEPTPPPLAQPLVIMPADWEPEPESDPEPEPESPRRVRSRRRTSMRLDASATSCRQCRNCPNHSRRRDCLRSSSRSRTGTRRTPPRTRRTSDDADHRLGSRDTGRRARRRTQPSPASPSTSTTPRAPSSAS